MISQGSKMQGTVERVTFGFAAFLTEFKHILALPPYSREEKLPGFLFALLGNEACSETATTFKGKGE